MDKVDRIDPATLLSPQVTSARYFFLHPERRGPGGCTLVLGGREHCAPDYRISRSSFPYHVLEYVEAGSGGVRLNGREHPLAAGTVFTYEPWTRYQIETDPEKPMVKYFLAFVGRGIAAEWRRHGILAGQSRQLASHAEVTGVLEDLLREGQRATAFAPRICSVLVQLLWLKIEAAAAAASHAREPSREAFLRCKALIDDQAERLGTLEEIAQAAGVETSSVCRWFRRYQGTSPYQYLLRRKMNAAAEYLIENGGLVKEVAQRVGFSDPFHFSRAFKAVHGVAPRTLVRRA